jgi:hypothetical protein
VNGAVEGAGSALHARAEVSDDGLFSLHGEDAMGANVKAHAAADAQLSIKPERDGSFEIT